jgi:hypothetical protein
VKYIVYKYGGGLSDEMHFDAHDLLTFTKGDIISRHGMTWKIDAVDEEKSLDNLMRIPTYWVYLTRVRMN